MSHPTDAVSELEKDISDLKAHVKKSASEERLLCNQLAAIKNEYTDVYSKLVNQKKETVEIKKQREQMKAQLLEALHLEQEHGGLSLSSPTGDGTNDKDGVSMVEERNGSLL